MSGNAEVGASAGEARCATRTTHRRVSIGASSSARIRERNMTSTAASGAGTFTSDIPIVLPLVPPKQMSHNARGSRWSTSRVSKSHRAKAKSITEAAIEGIEIPNGTHFLYDVDVFWGKGRLRCDEDGLSSMMKPILDGIADALGTTSDRKLHIGTYRQGRARDGAGWMVLTLRPDGRNHDCGSASMSDYLPEAA